MIGVPTAPNETGVDCTIRPITTAGSAGKPRATSSGEATAAVVPNPEAPLRATRELASVPSPKRLMSSKSSGSESTCSC